MCDKIFRYVAMSAIFSIVTVGWCTGPENQTIAPQRGAEVRILKPTTAGGGALSAFQGTGSIIGNRNIDGQGWFCVLTVDHVLSANQLPGGGSIAGTGMAQNNFLSNNANNFDGGAYTTGVLRRTRDIFGAASRIDLALMFVNYGAYNAINDLYVRTMVDDTNFRSFSIIGYGNEGKQVATGYQAQGNYGIQRYANNVVNHYAVKDYGAGDYRSDAVWSKVLVPGAAFLGSGLGLDGDSGAPIFITDAAQEPAQAPSYYTNSLFAVHEGGDRVLRGGIQYRDFGFDQWAVNLAGTDGTTDGRTYREWIMDACNAPVPEPGTIAVLTLGLAALARRRKKIVK